MARLRSIKPRLATMPGRMPASKKVADRFYLSKPWRALMRAIKAERGNRCQDCGEYGDKDLRIIGDHIIERKDGGADLDPRNIWLRCLPCHNTKTAKVRAAR